MIFNRLVSAGVDPDGQHERFHEVAVDAEPDPQLLVEGFDVDIAGSVAHRLADDAVHQLDDRGLIVEAHLGGKGGHLGVVVGDVEHLHQAVDVGVGTIGAVDEGPHGAGICYQELHRPAGGSLDSRAT